MKIVVAVFMGACSGFLIYIMCGMISGMIVPAAVALMGLTGWAASGYYLTRGAQTVSIVMTRGFLLGAAEWLLMIGAIIIGVARAGMIVRGGLMAGFSLFMAIACLTGFAIVHFTRREIKAN